jgi:hypothetical protein
MLGQCETESTGERPVKCGSVHVQERGNILAALAFAPGLAT